MFESTLLLLFIGYVVAVDTSLGLNNCHQHVDDSTSLMKCIQLFNGDYKSNNSDTKRKKIAIVTKYSDNIVDYASYSQYLLISYIHHHNNLLSASLDTNLYEYVYLPYYNDSHAETQNMDSPSKSSVYNFVSKFYTAGNPFVHHDYVQYPKLRYLLHAASMRTEAGERTFDYLLWIDADAIVVNFAFHWESIIEKHNRTIDIFAAGDVATSINTGVLLIKNSNWAIAFLELWRSLCCSELLITSNTIAANDQLGFDEVYKALLDRNKKKIAVLETHEINTVLPAMKTFSNPLLNPVLHLAAETSLYRKKVFKSIVRLYLDAQKHSFNKTKSPVGTTLKVSNAFLLNIAVDVYRVQYEGGISNVQQVIGNATEPIGESDHSEGSVFSLYRDLYPIVTELRLSGSKYAYSLEYQASAMEKAMQDGIEAVPGINAAAPSANLILESRQVRHRLTETYQSLVLELLWSHYFDVERVSSVSSQAATVELRLLFDRLVVFSIVPKQHKSFLDLFSGISGSGSVDFHRVDVLYLIPEYLKNSVELSKEYMDALLFGDLSLLTSSNSTPQATKPLRDVETELVRQLYEYIQCALGIMELIVSKSQRHVVVQMMLQMNAYKYFKKT